VVYGGDGYSKEWEEEALRRGLKNRKDTVSSIECLKNNEICNMLIKLGVYNQAEIDSRYEILLEDYNKTIMLEALTSLKMAREEIYPASIKYLNLLSDTVKNLLKIGVNNDFLLEDTNNLSTLIKTMKEKMIDLENNINYINNTKFTMKEKAEFLRDKVLVSMKELRKIVDIIETKVDKSHWPIPTYVDLLFGI
jgi:glutamine synthetase